jgi:hypothetical protein
LNVLQINHPDGKVTEEIKAIIKRRRTEGGEVQEIEQDIRRVFILETVK